MLDIEVVVNSAATHGKSELDRVGYLDGWRGLAIAYVLWAHFFSFPKSLGINSGRLGVDVFFVLSGFLMSRILFIKRVPLNIFYKRRISRILPIFVLFVVGLYAHAYFMKDSNEWHNALFTLTFLRTYVPTTPEIWNTGIPIGHLWSLNVEEHCYIFLSIITIITPLKGREGPALVLAGTIAILIHIAYIAYPSIAPHDFDIRTEAVASHLLVSAGYSLMSKYVVKFVRPWMPVMSFAAAVICYTEIVPWWSSMLFSPFLLTFTVNHLSETPAFLRKALAFSPLRLLGIWSYSIYLWQQPFYAYKQSGQAINGLAFLAAMVVGVLSFYLIENPARTWLNRIW